MLQGGAAIITDLLAFLGGWTKNRIDDLLGGGARAWETDAAPPQHVGFIQPLKLCPGSSAFVPGLDVPVGDAKACQGPLTKLTPFDTRMGHCRTGEPPGPTTNQLPGPFRPSRGVAGNGGFEEPLRNTMAPIRAFHQRRATL